MIVTKDLQDSIKEYTASFDLLKHVAKDLYNLYWKAGVSGDISGLADVDPATQAGKYTKANVVSALSLAENIDKFFGNVAVAQADYMTTIQALTHGDADLATVISPALEDYGGKALQFSVDLLTQYQRGLDLDNAYVNQEISAAVAATSDETIVFGADMTKDDLISAMVMVGQFQNFVENAAVTTGDYDATLAKWLRF
jgi:hypothetical protein